MSSVNWERINEIKGVNQIGRIVEVFELDYDMAPYDLKVNVLEYKNGKYIGRCNYGIWGPDQADEYFALHPQDTIEAALEDAIAGINSFFSASYPPEIIFWVKWGSEGKTILDGNQNLITREEAYKRRESHK